MLALKDEYVLEVGMWLQQITVSVRGMGATLT